MMDTRTRRAIPAVILELTESDTMYHDCELYVWRLITLVALFIVEFGIYLLAAQWLKIWLVHDSFLLKQGSRQGRRIPVRHEECVLVTQHRTMGVS